MPSPTSTLRDAPDPLDLEANEAAFVEHAARDLDGAQRTGMITIAFSRDYKSVAANHVIEHFAELIRAMTEIG